MDNPFSKIKQAYKESDMGLKRSLKKEANSEHGNVDVFEVIQNDDGFAEFLVGIDPNYANLDLDKKSNVQMIREKYLLYQQSQELKPDIQNIYEQEIIGELGVEIPDSAKDTFSAEIGKALKEMAQKDSLEFQKLKLKLEAYVKLKEELVDLESKFEDKVHLKGSEGMSAMKDRQDKLEKADGKILFSKAGTKAYFGRMWGNRDMKHALADFKHTYGIDKEQISGELKESKDDIKKAEKMREKLDELREYLLKDLEIGESLIEVAKKAAQESLNSTTEEISGIGRIDSMSKTNRDQLRAEIMGRKVAGTGVGEGLNDVDQAEITRLGELDEMDDLENDPTTTNADANKKQKLADLRKAQSERSKKRIEILEKARKTVSVLREGKGKKGGIDYSRITGPGGVMEQMRVANLNSDPRGPASVDVNDALKKELEDMIQSEVELVLERASVRSDKLGNFLQELNPYFEKWRLGGKDVRDKVQSFIVDTMKDVCKSNKVNPVLKVQMKAFLAQRGLNPVKFVIP